MQFKIKCVECGETIICDEAILDQQMTCGDCGCPILVEAYPKLVELRDKIDQERQEAKEQRAAEKAEQKRIAKAEKAKQKETQLALSLEQRKVALAEKHATLNERQQQQQQQHPQQQQWHGAGCPRCGSVNLSQKRETSGVGWALFIGGIILALFTCGIGLVLCVIAFFLPQRGNTCNDCGWQWKT